jgi:hypothetical protein
MTTKSRIGCTRYRLGIAVGIALCGLLLCPVAAGLLHAAEGEGPKSIRKTCGACPDGYATTGVTDAPEICKDGEPTLVQCVPLGGNLLSVCGVCPEGYSEMGHSNVPSRCGARDGGLVSQCQSSQLGSSLPDPNQGGVKCPPDCGSTAAPGVGSSPPPPKFRPVPEQK